MIAVSGGSARHGGTNAATASAAGRCCCRCQVRISSTDNCTHTHIHTRGPIDKISYDNLTIMPKLRSTYDGRLIYKTSDEGCEAFLRYDSLAKL